MECPKKPHAILLSSPGMGHLLPVLELGKHLVNNFNVKVTVVAITPPPSSAESNILNSATNSKLLDIVSLQPTPSPRKLIDIIVLAAMMREIRSDLRSTLAAMKPPPTVLVVDLFGTESLSIADEFKIPKYVFIASHAWFLALTIHLPSVNMQFEEEYVDIKDSLKIPGCASLRPEDFVDARRKQQYYENIRVGREIPMSDGILVNTWEDLQPKTLAALRDDNLLGGTARVPIYSIGPVVRSAEELELKSDDIFAWLNKQPNESVIYVSFGSGGVLSSEQIIELAWGLEMSHQRFIWVMRQFSGEDDIICYLPDGFLNRTKEVGLVVQEWAPQVDILRHPSTGAFLSHCGWNSTLESIMSGVPIVAWPLYAEQQMNATMLSEELNVAVKVNILPAENIVRKEEIEKVVRNVMQDKESAIRAKVKELKQSAQKALRKGGSSYQAYVNWLTNLGVAHEKTQNNGSEVSH